MPYSSGAPSSGHDLTSAHPGYSALAFRGQEKQRVWGIVMSRYARTKADSTQQPWWRATNRASCVRNTGFSVPGRAKTHARRPIRCSGQAPVQQNGHRAREMRDRKGVPGRARNESGIMRENRGIPTGRTCENARTKADSLQRGVRIATKRSSCVGIAGSCLNDTKPTGFCIIIWWPRVPVHRKRASCASDGTNLRWLSA